jgi:hypothetical protein
MTQLTETMRIRRAADAAWRVIDGQAVIISADAQRMRVLNEVGSWIWEQCEGKTSQEIAAKLSESFAVEPEAALRDVMEFLVALQGLRMVEGAEEP